MVKLLLTSAAAAATIIAAILIMPSRDVLNVGGVNILPWILPSVMTLALAEGIALSLRPRGYDWRAWFASSGDALVRQLVNLIPLSLVGPAFALAWAHRLTTVPLGAWWSFVSACLMEGAWAIRLAKMRSRLRSGSCLSNTSRACFGLKTHEGGANPSRQALRYSCPSACRIAE